MKHPPILTLLTALLLMPLGVLQASDASAIPGGTGMSMNKTAAANNSAIGTNTTPPDGQVFPKVGQTIECLSPFDGETIYMPNPHFKWSRLPDTALGDRHQIQIATDANFANIVRDESLEVVSRYVCAEPLAAGSYYWRVRKAGGEWPSKSASFKIAAAKVYPVQNGATQQEIKQVILLAAANTPSQVVFERGTYQLTDTINIQRVKDLVIDGGGSTFVLEKKAFDFKFSKNITLQNMRVEPKTDPSTHFDIVSVDPDNKSVTVKVKAGFPQDVSRYFTPGKGASIGRCADPVNLGKVIRYAEFSAQYKGAGIAGPDERGNYTFLNMPQAALKAMRPGMTAYLIKYSFGFLTASFTENVTLCHVSLFGIGGAITGIDWSAPSYLECEFLPLTANHYAGATGFISGGITGMWVENCKFELGVDDNMAVQALKMTLESIDTNSTAVIQDHPWIHEIRVGDEVLLWDIKRNSTATAKVLESLGKDGRPVASGELADRRPKKLKLAKSPIQLNAELGRAADASFKGVLLFRYSPNNEDFVFRNNKIRGGSSGCMFNGMRGLIAGNTFTNCRHAAVAAGYHSPDENSGYGARDVLVKSNLIVNCGGHGVITRSTANVGGNISIIGNVMKNTPIDNGYLWSSVFVKNNCDNIVVKDNTFESTVAPGGGAWIISEANRFGVNHDGNKIISPFTKPMLLQK